jgi:CBS domain-containing protein
MTEPAESEIVRDDNPLMLPPGTTVMQAARQMHSRDVSAVLVTEGDTALLGIFTERDAISRVLATGKDPAATALVDVMTDNPETITPEHTATEALRLMREAHCRHLPVMHEGKIVGIVTRNPYPGRASAGPPAGSAVSR